LVAARDILDTVVGAQIQTLVAADRCQRDWHVAGPRRRLRVRGASVRIVL